MSLRWRLK